MKKDFLDKIANKTLKVGVVGLGYVGLPLAVEKAKGGFVTTGFDISEQRIEMVNSGENYIGDVVNEDLKALVDSGALRASSDFDMLGECDFIAICVPTPLDIYQQPDISYVKSSGTEVARRLKPGMAVVLESTTYPGTTEELLKPLLEKESGLVCGKDFYLGFSPERVDPGNLIYKTKNTPKVVGAIGADATEVIAAVYRCVLDGDVKEVSSPSVAEMEKILENCYRNINIGFINEMAMLCHKMGINIWEVIEAASTKPYGFQAFYPGPGLGGHCIPLDPYYLAWKAREYGFHTLMIESSGMINDRMPEYCTERAADILNRVRKKCFRESKILVLGVAYKQNIDDYRESAALKVIEAMKKTGAEVDFYDPYIPVYKLKGDRFSGIKEINPAVISSYDLVMVTTPHTNIDYGMVAENAHYIFDTKDALKHIGNRENIELL